MSTRSRRANAGNRLEQLLAQQTPLNDEESELFAERDDDEDFDLAAEEERLRAAAAASDAGSDAGSQGSGDEGSGEGSGSDDGSGASVHDDSNFSDSSDDSELENDAEPADAGEKELAQEQRAAARERRRAERNKLFTIKRRAPPAPRPEGAPERRKRVFTSADVLREGRHSSRKSALRNKQHLIEHMREAEERRARYVPPQRAKQPRLTQAQRLEEAKKTEARNLASLNKFVELEEERKLQQRLAMISRRPKLTQFVRFHSTQYLAPPKLVEVVDDVKAEAEAEAETEAPAARGPELAGAGAGAGVKTEAASDARAPGAQDHAGASSAEAPASAGAPSPTSQQHAHDSAQRDESGAVKSEDSQQRTARSEQEPALPSNDDATTKETAASTPLGSAGDAAANVEEAPVKTDVGAAGAAGMAGVAGVADAADAADTVKTEAAETIKTEEAAGGAAAAELSVKLDEDAAELNRVQGPAHLRTYNFLSLHEFPDVAMNKYAARNIILGRIASVPAHAPLKRMCPFSGLPARYLDPATGVAYYGLETNKLIKRAAENDLCWSKELGGVFLASAGAPRHAKGVPPGFA